MKYHPSIVPQQWWGFRANAFKFGFSKGVESIRDDTSITSAEADPGMIARGTHSAALHGFMIGQALAKGETFHDLPLTIEEGTPE